MRRLFSGNKSDESDNFTVSRSSERTGTSTIPNIHLNDNLLNDPEELSEELIPIITLLTAHTHRRYHEGIVMILHDLKNDGTQANRKWKESYGVLIGTQIALWDTNELVGNNSVDFRKFASKPTYINLNDATLKPIDAVQGVSNISNKKLENILVISTTLKNRYFFQFDNKESFSKWSAAIRLSIYENVSLQEAYTGAFLSSRGARLGDIKIILASTKYNYEDWVSVRFGSGMPWRRCYAVISQQGHKKSLFGQINFYEDDKKTKKQKSMAIVTSASEIYAVYPSSPKLIDTSTIIKLEGTIQFEKTDSPTASNIFIMPEKHMAVPGYDTIIRFLIPAMNAFQLYGRPKRLIANKDDSQSLLFALPTLPHIYYLEVEDLLRIVNSATSLQWSSQDWKNHINDLLLRKTSSGYSGCGTSSDLKNSVTSSVIESGELFDSTGTILSPKINPQILANSPKLQKIVGLSPRVLPQEPLSHQSSRSPQRTQLNVPLMVNNNEKHSSSENLSHDFQRAVKDREGEERNAMYNRPAEVVNKRSNKPNKYGDELLNGRQNDKNKLPERSGSAISSIFNMYGSEGSDEITVSGQNINNDNPSNMYNAFIKPRLPDSDKQRVASEIETLGTGIKNIAMNVNINKSNINDFEPIGIAINHDESNEPDVFDPDFMEQDKILEYDNELVSTSSISSDIRSNGHNNTNFELKVPKKQYQRPSMVGSDYSSRSGSYNSGDSASIQQPVQPVQPQESQKNQSEVIRKPKYNPFAEEEKDQDQERRKENAIPMAQINKFQQPKKNKSPSRLSRPPPEQESFSNINSMGPSPSSQESVSPNRNSSPHRGSRTIQDEDEPKRRRPPVPQQFLDPPKHSIDSTSNVNYNYQGNNNSYSGNNYQTHSSTSFNYSNTARPNLPSSHSVQPNTNQGHSQGQSQGYNQGYNQGYQQNSLPPQRYNNNMNMNMNMNNNGYSSSGGMPQQYPNNYQGNPAGGYYNQRPQQQQQQPYAYANAHPNQGNSMAYPPQQPANRTYPRNNHRPMAMQMQDGMPVPQPKQKQQQINSSPSRNPYSNAPQ